MSPASNPAELDHIAPELRERAFQLRPVWQRFLVVLAGPVANFMLAIAIFAAFSRSRGRRQTTSSVKSCPNSAAAHAGIQAGDRIVSVADRDTPTFDDVANVVLIVRMSASIEIERGGQRQELNVQLGSQEKTDPTGRKMRGGALGVMSTTTIGEPVPVLEAIPMAVDQTVQPRAPSGMVWFNS